jgi:hypothetical protein
MTWIKSDISQPQGIHLHHVLGLRAKLGIKSSQTANGHHKQLRVLGRCGEIRNDVYFQSWSPVIY